MRISLAAALCLLLPVSTAAGSGQWLTGRIHSLAPSEALLVVDVLHSRDGAAELVPVRIEQAVVVRVWRDPRWPWKWRERSTRLHRWPAETFIVVFGQRDPSGVLHARRIEIPQAGQHHGKPR